MKSAIFSGRRAIKIVTIIIIVILAFYLWADRHTPNTRDAYVNAFVVPISADVAGRISVVFVRDNQSVKIGRPLFIVDQIPYKIAVTLAQAKYNQTLQVLDVLKSKVDTAASVVTQRQAVLKQMQQKFDEINALAIKGSVSQLAKQIATKNLAAAKGLLKQAEAELDAAQKALGEKGKSNNRIIVAKAHLDLAKWQLAQTIVKAPADGVITALKLRPGWYANVGTPLLSFIENKKWWVVANLKEGNLARVRVGEKAEISIDMYPGKIFHGTVIKIERGVRLQSSIPNAYLPYVPSTTNWVKLAQRFPVRIEISDAGAQYPLRVGATAHVVIFTQHSAWLGWISRVWLRIHNWFGYL